MRKDFVGPFVFLSSSVHVLFVVVASDAWFLTKSPSWAVIGAVLCLAFAVVFLVVIYLKYCHRIPDNPLDQIRYDPLNGSMPRCSGFDRGVIDSLPVFKFSSLKGSKQGLKCAVCMSMFQDTELLQLLPECNHTFHTTCVDRWLENHPTCPLCLYEYDARELSVSDVLHGQNSLQSDSNSLSVTDVDIYIEREENLRWSRRFGPRNWSKDFNRSRKADHEIGQKDDTRGNRNMFHRFNHKIVVRSLIIKQRRHVDLRCKNLDRYSNIEENVEGIRPGNSVRPSNVSDGRTSVSAITGLSRFANGSGRRYHEYPFNRNSESTGEMRIGN